MGHRIQRNHRSNWATLALIWLIGLVGCADNAGQEQPEAPPLPQTQDPIDEQAARDAAWEEVIAVHKLLQEWDGEYHETWYTDDPRAAEIFPGWPTKPVTLPDGRKVLRAWCDHENCFAPGYGHPMADPSFVPEDYEQEHGSDFEVPKSRPLRLGTAEQANCASGSGTLCPGPWIRHIGSIVPDNAHHTFCRWPFLGTINDYWWEIGFLAFSGVGWDSAGLTFTEFTGADCPGWSYRPNTTLDEHDTETGARGVAWIAEADVYRFAPIYADGGIDAQGHSGYHQTRPVADVFFYSIASQAILERNCPLPDFNENPHPVLGCTTSWFLNPTTSRSPCYWQQYQRNCPSTGVCASCPYHRVAASSIGFQLENVDLKADYYGIDRWQYRTHTACHEFGHSLGLTHPRARYGSQNQMRPRAYETCMSSVHPGATDYWGTGKGPNQTITIGEFCELSGGYGTKVVNGVTVCDTSTVLGESGRRLYGTTDY